MEDDTMQTFDEGALLLVSGEEGSAYGGEEAECLASGVEL